jgi:hypothetical protein
MQHETRSICGLRRLATFQKLRANSVSHVAVFANYGGPPNPKFGNLRGKSFELVAATNLDTHDA